MDRTLLVNQFDGGMATDLRALVSNTCRACAHFDAFTIKHKLTPYRSYESGDANASTDLLRNFAYQGTKLFGLGSSTSHAVGHAHLAIFSKSSFANDTWTETPFGYFDTQQTDQELNVFTPYHGEFFGLRDSRWVWKYNPDTDSFTNNEADLTASAYTTAAQGLVHSKDDVLYLPYGNKIAVNNNGSWTVVGLTLPTGMIITSLSEYGDFLAIGCRQSDGQRSRVFLWNRDTSVNTLSESLDWGEGDLMVLGQLFSYLVGVSGPVNSFSNNYFQARTVGRYYDGSGPGAKPFVEFRGSAGGFSPNIFQGKQVLNNRLYFASSIPVGSTGYSGIWSIGQNTGGEHPFAMTFDRYLDNSATNGGNIAFFLLADYAFITYISSATYFTTKTDDTATYTLASVYETAINPNMPREDRIQLKQLKAVGATYEPLPSGGQVVVQYRVDGGSWVTCFTETTAGAVATEPVVNASNGDEFVAGKEYEFRVQSTGGAEVTGIIYRYPLETSNV